MILINHPDNDDSCLTAYLPSYSFRLKSDRVSRLVRLGTDEDRLALLRTALLGNAVAVAEALLGPPNKALSSATTLRWGNKGSLSLELRGRKKGFWFSHEEGEGSDLLGLIRHVRGCNFPDALAWARSHTGLAEPGEFEPAHDRARREREDADRRARRAEAAAKDDTDEALRLAKRIARAQAIVRESVAVEETAAHYYLTQVRGIPRPSTGWPDCVRFHGPSRSVVLVATTAGGLVQAVQQIHLDEHGEKIGAEEMSRRRLPAVKMTTGLLAGAAVRMPGALDGPLLVAEGPETGLAAWASTGHATWVALGTVGKVTLPSGRRVAIATDDNPPANLAKEGRAARALRDALRTWREAGIDVVVATPWVVRRRDKSDFADVILAHGPDAVRARFAAALAPQGTGVVRVPLAEARKQVAKAVGAFFGKVEAASIRKVEWEQQAAAAMSANVPRAEGADGESDLHCPDLEARPAPFFGGEAVWGEVFDAPLPEREPDTFTHGIRVDVGVGKSHEARAQIARTLGGMRKRGDMRTIVLAVPQHALGDEQLAAFQAMPEVQEAGLRVKVWRGRAAPDPSHPDYTDASIRGELKATMCGDLERVKDAQSVALNAQTTCCVRTVKRSDGTKKKTFCPLFAGCAYQVQIATEADLWIISHELLFHEKPAAMGDIAAVVVDEGAWRKGLIGEEGRPLTLSIDAIGSDCTICAGKMLTDRTATVRLENLRNQLLKLVNHLPDGPITRDGLFTALTADSCAEAEKLEWRRRLDTLHPGQTRKERKETIEKLLGNRTVKKMVMVWSALRIMLSPDAPEASGWLSIGVEATKDGPVRVLRLKGRSDIKEGWKVPTLLLDALLPIDLVRSFWPDAMLVANVKAQMPHQRVRQVIDRAFSKSMLEPLDEPSAELNPKEAQRLQNRLTDLRAILVREALSYAPGRVLVVLQQSVEEALHKLGRLPSNMVTAHHNAIAGRDEWRDVAAVIVVGRTLPPPYAVEQVAEAMTGAAIAKPMGWYERADAVREMADGSTVPAEADRHADPLAESIRWQIAEGELVQIVGRGRGVNRTAANPLDVLVLTDVPLPVQLVGTLGAHELTPGPADRMMAAGGVVLDNARHAAAAYPNLWSSHEAARKAMQRERSGTNPYVESMIGECLTPRLCYLVAGAGQKPAKGSYCPDLCPDPAAFLTRALGPLAWCKLDEVSLPDPVPPAKHPSQAPVSAAREFSLAVQGPDHCAIVQTSSSIPSRGLQLRTRYIVGRRHRDEDTKAGFRSLLQQEQQMTGTENFERPECPPTQEPSSAIRTLKPPRPGLKDSASEFLSAAPSWQAPSGDLSRLQREGHGLTRPAPFSLVGLTSGDAASLEAEAVLKRAQADESPVPLTRVKLKAEADGLDGLADRLRRGHVEWRSPGLRVGRGGEVSSPPVDDMPLILRDVAEVVQTAPSILEAEATRDRLALAHDAGVLTQAVHAAESVGASNAIEQMLTHQMALAHTLAMRLMSAADRDLRHGGNALAETSRAATSAARLMDGYTRAALALDRLRNGGRQHVTVQHVNVGDGGQAVVAGSMTPRGGGVPS